LNEEAPENILLVLLTLLTFQADNGWLNEEASENMYLIQVTRPTFQRDKD
jgi:hypothetical protein